MRCGEEIELFTSSVMWAVWAEEENLTHHTRRKFNFDRLLYIIFFMTQIHRVRFLSVNGEASRGIDFFQNIFFFKDQDFIMKFIWQSYSLYTKDTHQIWCRSEKLLSKSKFCSGLRSESGSWFYFGFQYQTYISYIEDTHQILFGSTNAFESYCVHSKSPRTARQTDRQTNRQADGNFFLLILSSKTYKTRTFIKGENFFFSLMQLQYFLFLHTPYVMRK